MYHIGFAMCSQNTLETLLHMCWEGNTFHHYLPKDGCSVISGFLWIIFTIVFMYLNMLYILTYILFCIVSVVVKDGNTVIHHGHLLSVEVVPDLLLCLFNVISEWGILSGLLWLIPSDHKSSSFCVRSGRFLQTMTLISNHWVWMKPIWISQTTWNRGWAGQSPYVHIASASATLQQAGLWSYLLYLSV